MTYVHVDSIKLTKDWSLTAVWSYLHTRIYIKSDDEQLLSQQQCSTSILLSAVFYPLQPSDILQPGRRVDTCWAWSRRRVDTCWAWSCRRVDTCWAWSCRRGHSSALLLSESTNKTFSKKQQRCETLTVIFLSAEPEDDCHVVLSSWSYLFLLLFFRMSCPSGDCGFTHFSLFAVVVILGEKKEVC